MVVWWQRSFYLASLWFYPSLISARTEACEDPLYAMVRMRNTPPHRVMVIGTTHDLFNENNRAVYQLKTVIAN